jgi:lipopolysaccharide export system permease protein
MISLIDRYIGRQIIVSSLFVLCMFALLQSAFSFLDEVGKTDRGNYQVSDALLYVWLMLPSRILDFFPMSVLVGSLFALGNLASNSELTVLRAAGMTTWRITGSAIKASLLLMLLVIINSEWIAPQATQSAKQLKVNAISGGDLSFSQSGLWAKQKDQVIQIGKLINANQLQQLTIYQLNQNYQLASILQAENATKITATAQPISAEKLNLLEEQWQLNQVIETIFHADRVETNHSEHRLWFNPLQTEQLNSLALEPESLNIAGLLSYMTYLESNNLETNNYELALWRKFLQPLVIAVMLFLAASFVFGPMRDVSVGAKIMTGIMLGFAFHIANQSFGPVSLVFNFWPFAGAFLPLLLFAGLAYWLMQKNS